jgi:hypothetical protein
MSRRKPLASLAAITATLALAAPAASASAAPSAREFHTTPIVVGGRLVPGSPPCWFLIHQIQHAVASGNTAWANFVSTVFIYSGCGGAAI